ncbi:hypothetical protein DM860_015291 [Cuscuta australis]|uniref:RNase H type-1 domain-containing protein n=1 Tax=Cuscuta australis TaxID=267555 RepID=A0A328DNR7_9ASTE|nr:hypothetical protein DM860_015291 [Cuscuta australis]
MANRDIQHLQATMDNLDLGEEDIGISFEADSGIHTNLGDDQTWSIVGRLLTDKPIKFDIFKNVFASVWKPAIVVRPEVAADWAREVCGVRTSRDVHGGTMKARNQACWELKVVRPEVAADWAREVCGVRTSRDVHGGTMVMSEGSGLQQLNRSDLLRCFVDAPMFEQDGSTSVAAALLDGVIGGFNKLITCPLVPRYVETLAIKEALSWLKEKNIHDVAVFSDCVQAVHALKNDVIEARSYLNGKELV